MPLSITEPNQTIAVSKIFDDLDSTEYSIEIPVSSNLYVEFEELNSYLNSLNKDIRHYIFKFETKGLCKNDIDENFKYQLKLFIHSICTESSWIHNICPKRSEMSVAKRISLVLNGKMIDIREKRQQAEKNKKIGL